MQVSTQNVNYFVTFIWTLAWYYTIVRAAISEHSCVLQTLKNAFTLFLLTRLHHLYKP